MKFFMHYWIIGIVIVGLFTGAQAAMCNRVPDTPAYELAALVLIWPATIISVVIMGFNDVKNPNPCGEK